jgi:hypothetical protein
MGSLCNEEVGFMTYSWNYKLVSTISKSSKLQSNQNKTRVFSKTEPTNQIMYVYKTESYME